MINAFPSGQGGARRDWALRVVAALGRAGHGAVRRGKARQGFMVINSFWQGRARCDRARSGPAGLCRARRGREFGHQMINSFNIAERGRARRGRAWRGKAVPGSARHGREWLGDAGCGGARQGIQNSDIRWIVHFSARWGSARPGMVWRVLSRQGAARQGKVRRCVARLGSDRPGRAGLG
jgi:hypothetical protein